MINGGLLRFTALKGQFMDTKEPQRIMLQQQKLMIQKNPYIPFLPPNEKSVNVACLIDTAVVGPPQSLF